MTEVAWIEEMNLGIQEALKGMPTTTWSDDILGRIQQLAEGSLN